MQIDYGMIRICILGTLMQKNDEIEETNAGQQISRL